MQLTEEKLQSPIGTCDLHLMWVLRNHRNHKVHSGSFHFIRSLAVVPTFPPDLTSQFFTNESNTLRPLWCNGKVNTTLEMPADFAIYTKCNESPLLSERYTLCGATSGIGIDAKPITITVDPWMWAARIISALYSCSEKFGSEGREGLLVMIF